jgi:hypothetical protein
MLLTYTATRQVYNHSDIGWTSMNVARLHACTVSAPMKFIGEKEFSKI